MRPSAGTPYFARVPETLVSPQAPQDRDRATGIASPLRTPEPKADAANHATGAAPARPRSTPSPVACPAAERPHRGRSQHYWALPRRCFLTRYGQLMVQVLSPIPATGDILRTMQPSTENGRRRRLHAHETHHHHYRRRFPAPYPADAGRRSVGDTALKPDQHDARTDQPRPLPRDIA